METKIKWNEGEGYITATYEGSGNGSASISSDVNEGIDREQSIKVETTDKSVSATLMVSQEGMREVFEPSDVEFVLADGGTYNVLKVREKKINTIRLTLKVDTFIPTVVNPETMTYPISWDYPVKSLIRLRLLEGSVFVSFFTGEKDYYGPQKYWSNDGEELYLEAHPAEDDYYIYKVEIV